LLNHLVYIAILEQANRPHVLSWLQRKAQADYPLRLNQTLHGTCAIVVADWRYATLTIAGAPMQFSTIARELLTFLNALSRDQRLDW